MDIKTDEIADGIYRFSTFVEGAGIPFNQFLVDAEEPLLFHTGLRGMFPLVSEAVAKVTPPDRIRWITFGHFEADECGSMNDWLAVAPQSQIAQGVIGCLVSVNDMADRPPRPLENGEVIDLGGKRVKHIDTPHVPHGWDARLLFEETTGTLFCGDLFTALGEAPAMTSDDLVGPAGAAEDAFQATSITGATAPTIRGLAEHSPKTLALMHGPAFNGDCNAALHGLADNYAARFDAS